MVLSCLWPPESVGDWAQDSVRVAAALQKSLAPRANSVIPNGTGRGRPRLL